MAEGAKTMFDQLKPSEERMKTFHDNKGFEKLQKTGTCDASNAELVLGAEVQIATDNVRSDVENITDIDELPPPAMRSDALKQVMDLYAPDTVRELPVFSKSDAAKNDNAVKSNEDDVTPIPGSGVITTVPAEGATLKYDYLDEEDGIPPTIWSER